MTSPRCTEATPNAGSVRCSQRRAAWARFRHCGFRFPAHAASMGANLAPPEQAPPVPVPRPRQAARSRTERRIWRGDTRCGWSGPCPTRHRVDGRRSANNPLAHHWKVSAAHRFAGSKAGIEWQFHRARTRVKHGIVATPSCRQAAASTIGSLVAGCSVQRHHMMDDDVARLQVEPDHAVV